MKKVFSNTKLTTPAQVVRRVLSRASIIPTPSKEQQEHHQQQQQQQQKQEEQNSRKKCVNDTKSGMSSCKSASKSTTSENLRREASLAMELEMVSLREQVEELRRTIVRLENDADKGRVALAQLAREKQQLTMELRKEQRSSANLKQQLEEEREFYFKEKERYCEEMRSCKRLKQKMKEGGVPEKLPSDIMGYMRQIDKLKVIVQQTLEANYNLTLKFMRMKNTKTSLKTSLKLQETKHREELEAFRTQIEQVRADIDKIGNKRFKHHVSPSNKQFLHIIKQNGTLLHENLSLHSQIDHLNKRIERHKAAQLLAEQRLLAKHESSKKLKIGRRKGTTILATEQKPSSSPTEEDCKSSKKEEVLRTKSSVTETKAQKSAEIVPTVITIFQNEDVDKKEETAVSKISIKDGTQISKEKESKEKNGNEKSVPVVVRSTSQHSSCSSAVVSENCSSSNWSGDKNGAARTQSAPEIVQTVQYVSKHKPH